MSFHESSWPQPKYNSQKDRLLHFPQGVAHSSSRFQIKFFAINSIIGRFGSLFALLPSSYIAQFLFICIGSLWFDCAKLLHKECRGTVFPHSATFLTNWWSNLFHRCKLNLIFIPWSQMNSQLHAWAIQTIENLQKITNLPIVSLFSICCTFS